MAVEDKTTYGENYWHLQIEAEELFNEHIEQAITPTLYSYMIELGIEPLLDPAMKGLFDAITQPRDQAWAGVGMRFASEVADMALAKAANPPMRELGYKAERLFLNMLLSPAQASALYQRKKLAEHDFDYAMSSAGYDEGNRKWLYEAMRPYPAIPDLILWGRYHADPGALEGAVNKYLDIDPALWPVWEWLGLQRLTIIQAQTLYKRGLLSDTQFDNELTRIGWSDTDRPRIEELAYAVPNAMLLVQGGLMAELSDDKLLADISIADIHPKYAQTYMNAVLTKPSTADIIAFELRRDPGLAGLPAELRKIGIHPAYAPMLRELAHIIPPVGDIITMAVREAFTPAIAARFGQYEDFPPPFAEWAAKKGLSQEWAERYWASHWSLPSAQQGFEMLHRGAVNQAELNMLLRALDIMPFWRDKLTKIAFRRLTRVDVRRMYKIGVLSESEVYEAYLEHGYNPRDAKRMTDFTVQWAMPKEASITRSDILTAYKNRMIDRPTASQLLENMGEEFFHRDFMLTAVDYKKGLEATETKIKGIRNLYRKRQYTVFQASDELSKLDLPSAEINNLMEQWWYEIKAEPARLWTTAQTLSFIKAGLITKERGIVELQLIGYDAEHIDIHLRSLE